MENSSTEMTITFFVGMLHMHQVGFEPTISPSIHPLLWEELVQSELKLIGFQISSYPKIEENFNAECYG